MLPKTIINAKHVSSEINVVSTNSIENVTRCMRPCHYKEYRMVNVPTAISETNTEFSSIFMFWFVSTETLVEEQSLVYPWQTLVVQLITDQNKLDHAFSKSQVAEFGGTLGLFIGFNFISLCERTASFFSFIKNLWDGKVMRE